MFRSVMWIWVVVMVLSLGLQAGGVGQADTFDRTYTVEDYEPGGKLHQDESQSYPQFIEQFEPKDREPSLWAKQLACAILNATFGVSYSVAQFAESHSWVPWVAVSYLLVIWAVMYTLYTFAKRFRGGYLLDSVDIFDAF